jgi:hypothetical protein
MSLYLKFLFEVASAPYPHDIVLIEHQLEWVNKQISEEVHYAFPEAKMISVPASITDLPHYDLIILPYMRMLPQERPVIRRLKWVIACRGRSWVMIYGIHYRNVILIPGAHFSSYWRNSLLLPVLIRWAKRFRLGKAARVLDVWFKLKSCEF